MCHWSSAAPSRRTTPRAEGQTPTNARDNEDLPDALAPMRARPIPAVSENDTLETIICSDPGAATDRSLTESSCLGRGNTTDGLLGNDVVLRMLRSRPMP